MLIHYTTGDLLESNAEALVNTVNCEGFMGKGIAYQFKLKFPNMNRDYIKACKAGSLVVGKMHYYREDKKLIINFPTKDKWRANSKMEYIETGLDALVVLINDLNIQSIAIPPLGSGNGGLVWDEVKKLIENKLSILSNNIDIYIYEPSRNYKPVAKVEPKLSVSALILMAIKMNLNKFNKLRLQKSAYFTNIYFKDNYFNFKAYKYGPYDYTIDIISKNIKDFQDFHKTNNTKEAYDILLNKIISDSTQKKLDKLLPSVINACNFVDTFQNDKDLECCATITFLLENRSMSESEIIENFKKWSEYKSNQFSERNIIEAINTLYNYHIIDKDLTGYTINKNL